jgi:hypothetical protein
MIEFNGFFRDELADIVEADAGIDMTAISLFKVSF